MFSQSAATSRRNAPETSRIAASKQTPGKITRMHETIIALIMEYGPMTDYELRDKMTELGIPHSFSGVAARRGDLIPPRGKGLRDSGVRHNTPNNSPAIVWELDPNETPMVLPSKIRNLRGSQRTVYELFVRHGDMTHGEAFKRYLDSLPTDHAMEIMSESGVRSRVAELVALDVIKVKVNAIPTVWGLV